MIAFRAGNRFWAKLQALLDQPAHELAFLEFFDQAAEKILALHLVQDLGQLAVDLEFGFELALPELVESLGELHLPRVLVLFELELPVELLLRAFLLAVLFVQLCLELLVEVGLEGLLVRLFGLHIELELPLQIGDALEFAVPCHGPHSRRYLRRTARTHQCGRSRFVGTTQAATCRRARRLLGEVSISD